MYIDINVLIHLSFVHFYFFVPTINWFIFTLSYCWQWKCCQHDVFYIEFSTEIIILRSHDPKKIRNYSISVFIIAVYVYTKFIVKNVKKIAHKISKLWIAHIHIFLAIYLQESFINGTNPSIDHIWLKFETMMYVILLMSKPRL